MQEIFGLVAPSGSGKGYAKNIIKGSFPDMFNEPVVYTTRPKRQDDGLDRVAGLDESQFLMLIKNGTILFQHQPFPGLPYLYGFGKDSLEKSSKRLLTEVHIDNVIPFKNRYKRKLFLLAIIPSMDLLELNLDIRGSESESQKVARLVSAKSEIALIHKLTQRHYIDNTINLNLENRHALGSTILMQINNWLHKS